MCIKFKKKCKNLGVRKNPPSLKVDETNKPEEKSN